jgi:hypothetical protein
LRFDLRKKESEGWKNHATSEDNPFSRILAG